MYNCTCSEAWSPQDLDVGMVEQYIEIVVNNKRNKRKTSVKIRGF